MGIRGRNGVLQPLLCEFLKANSSAMFQKIGSRIRAVLRPRTLTGKLSVGFFVLLFLFSTGQYFLITSLWRIGIREQDQRQYWGVALAVASDIQPLLNHRNQQELLFEQLARILALNPGLDIGIIDAEGNLRLTALSEGPRIFFVPAGKRRIATKPIEHFLSARPIKDLPVLGENLRVPDSDGHIFSAARAEFYGEPAYIYVQLDSSNTRLHRQALESLYLIKGGALFTGFLTILATLLGFVILRFLTKRFQQMTGTVTRIARGEYELLLDESGNDEVGQLARDVNRMTLSIVSSMRAAEQSDMFRRNMISALAHDIGSPLAALRAATSQIVESEPNLTSDERELQIQIIQRSGAAVYLLIQDLLNLSKIEHGALALRLDALEVGDLFYEDLLPRTRHVAAEYGVEVQVAMSAATIEVCADYNLISRALTNLIENAIRYNDRQSDGVVVIEAMELETEVVIAVRDNGPGLSDEQKQRVFDRFYRADYGSQKNVRGSGLGLWIVKAIVEVHGSTIAVEDCIPTGARFFFSLQKAGDIVH